MVYRRMKKRRQHHVWKAYLRAWATNDQIYVLQDRKVRLSNINDVAVQRDFYRLNNLTPEDVEHIRKLWIEPSARHSHKLHEQTLQMFATWPAMKRALEAMGPAALPALVEMVEERMQNAEEDYHAGIESGVARFIEAARNGDFSFYDKTENAAALSHFMAVQHFRTAAMRNRVTARVKDAMGIDMSRTWNVVAHIFAANVGFSIFTDRKRRPMALLENRSDIPFIASDQPTVNLLGGSSDDKPPAYFALYYPVSPRYALLMDDADGPCGIADAPITNEVAIRLNAAQLRMGFRQVFAASKEQLEGYLAAAAA